MSSEPGKMYPQDDYQDPKEIAKTFKAFYNVPENLGCFDCGAEAREWVSVNNGISLCDKCAELHRTFGEHVSTIRSTQSPEWRQSELNMLRNGGNRKLRDFFSEYEFDPTEPRIFKYKTLAAFWYRKKLRHYVEGKMDPEKPPKETHMQQIEHEGFLDSIVEKFSKLGGMIGNVLGMNNKSQEEIPAEREPQKKPSFVGRSIERMKSGVQTAVDYIKDKATAAIDSDSGEEVPIHTEETTEGIPSVTKAQSLEEAVKQIEKDDKLKGISPPKSTTPIPNLDTTPLLENNRSSSIVENLEDAVADFEAKDKASKDSSGKGTPNTRRRLPPTTEPPKWKFPLKKKSSTPKPVEQPKEEKKGGLMEAASNIKNKAMGIFTNALHFVKDQAHPKDRVDTHETTVTTTTTTTNPTATTKPTEDSNLKVFDWDEVRWDSPKVKKLFENKESDKMAHRQAEESKEGTEFMREKFGNW